MNVTTHLNIKNLAISGRFVRAFALAVLLVTLAMARAKADLIITSTSTAVAPGGSATISFFVASNSDDTLSDFSLELMSTGLPGSYEGFMAFTAAQPEPYGNPDYVFYGQSADQDYDSPFWGPPHALYPPFIPGNTDDINGGDQDDSALGYVTLSTTPMFLVSVKVQLSDQVLNGEQFEVLLVPNDYSGNPEVGNTNFDDPINYTSSPAIVSVSTAVTPIPEPSPIICIMTGLALFAVFPWARRMGLLRA